MSNSNPALLCRPLLAAQGSLLPIVSAALCGAGNGAFRWTPSSLHTSSASRAAQAAEPLKQQHSLFLSDISLAGHRAPLLLGFMNYYQRHVPSVGFFEPIGASSMPHSELKVDRHVELIYRVFGLKGDPHHMTGAQDADAARLIATGRQGELLDRIYSAYQSYRDGHEMVLVEGPGPIMGGTELDAQVASALSTPVLMCMHGAPRATANDYYNMAMLKRQVFLDHKVDVLGVVMNALPRAHHALLTGQLKERFEKAGVPFAGALPEDPLLSTVRLDEVKTALGAEVIYGDPQLVDVEFDDVIVACQRIEELLEILADGRGRPLIVTSMDRLDIVLGLLAAQISVRGPSVAGVLLTQAGSQRMGRAYARDTVGSIFAGISQGGLYRGSLLPVLACDTPLTQALAQLGRLDAAILPTSERKVAQCKLLFDKHIDANPVVAGLQQAGARPARMTPKMFQHTLKSKCSASPQHIVLPESLDKRVLAAAAEVTSRGLARVTLLGDRDTVASEAKKLGLDISACHVHDPQRSDRKDKYVNLLVEARKKKGMARDTAADLIANDVNFFGTMMVAAGDADGMVSGALHTTAATIRPALQVLKAPDGNLVSSVFFMCLPDKVLVYGDCAVNVNPTAEDLAAIAITSADTAEAFGIEPRVAMLSYSTLGSGSGPDVQKVLQAVQLVKQRRPDIKVEGPIQYDAAIDPAVAAVKIKAASEVAGKATVFIFPDLNTGNNTYKAVQQSTGAIAMGPVMQGLLKPVNDLSRGCTVPDIVNTICVTSIQAMQYKAKAGGPAPAAVAAAAAAAAPAS